ncbi:MAG TPA: plastocyanin/azurin family copper-binding protein [Solirubrobacterales bacterium]
MRVANALLVAGIVIVIAGLSGASLAADDSGRTTPSQDVVATEEVGGGGTAAGEASDPAPAEPAGDEQGDRVPDEVATEEVTPTFDGGRGGGDVEEVAEEGGGEEDRGGKEKQPLADVGVDMVNISFKPKSVTVKPGDEVTWTNKDTAQHNAVGQGAADFDTGLLEKGETGTVPFNDTGTFRYICTVHPTMKGEVVVGSGSGGSGGKDGTSSGTGATTSGSGGSGSVFPSDSGSSGTFSGGGSSSSGGGSLPNTGQAELPLLLLGSALIVLGLLGRAFHEYWIWR